MTWKNRLKINETKSVVILKWNDISMIEKHRVSTKITFIYLIFESAQYIIDNIFLSEEQKLGIRV